MFRVVLLSAWGSPVSTAYLRRISSLSGLSLTAVYEENEKLAKDIERIYRERFGDDAPTFQGAELMGLPSVRVPNLRSEETLKTLRELEPDLMILGGTSIVKAPLLEIPRLGTLNCHPGILPRYRGCTCVEWALYEDEPVGATCHLVSEEIDAGPMLRREVMPVYKDDTYKTIRLRMFDFQSQVMSRAVADLAARGQNAIHDAEPFIWADARYYKPIPEDLMKIVLFKLQQGIYRHAIDRHESGPLSR